MNKRILGGLLCAAMLCAWKTCASPFWTRPTKC